MRENFQVNSIYFCLYNNKWLLYETKYSGTLKK